MDDKGLAIVHRPSSLVVMDEKQGGGRVVYSRPEGEGGGGGARPEPPLGGAAAAAGAYDSLSPWRTLVPLCVGFALLVVLVLGLGYQSAAKVSDVTRGAKDEYRRLSTMSDTLLNLRLALSRLDTEARIRARVDAGTAGVMLPPSDLKLRNERGEVEKLLAEFDLLPLGDPAKKQDVHERVVRYVG